MTEQVPSANSSNHDTQNADKYLTVRLSDKAVLDSNAIWSPTSPFDLDFSCLDVDSPKVYSQDEQKLETELGPIELDFSYLNINSPRSQCSDEKHYSKSSLELGGKSGWKDAHSQAEFRIDIPNVVPQTENECHRFYEEWASPFSNGDDTSSSDTLTGSFGISHIEFEPLLPSFFGNRKPERHRELSPLGSNNFADLLQLFRSNSTFGACCLCNVDLVEERDVFIYMDKPFCSEECRDIFIEGESGYETMIDEEGTPVANSYEHAGPIFLPINE